MYFHAVDASIGTWCGISGYKRSRTTGAMQPGGYKRSRTTGAMQPGGYKRSRTTGAVQPGGYKRSCTTGAVQPGGYKRSRTTGAVQPVFHQQNLQSHHEKLCTVAWQYDCPGRRIGDGQRGHFTESGKYMVSRHTALWRENGAGPSGRKFDVYNCGPHDALHSPRAWQHAPAPPVLLSRQSLIAHSRSRVA